MLKRLKYRFVLVTMLLVFIILTTIFTSIYILMANFEKKQTLNFMETLAKLDGNIPAMPPPMFNKDKGHPKNHDTISSDSALFFSSFIVSVDHEDHIVLKQLSHNYDISTQTDQIREFIDLAYADGKESGIINVNHTQVRYLITDKPYGDLIVFTDCTTEVLYLRRLIIFFILIELLSLFGLFIAALYLSTWAINPIETAWEKQKQFVADASHELRTPLTVIAANTDVVLSNPLDYVTNQAKWLNYIKNETERMNKLVTDLLYLAKLDNEKELEPRSLFNLSDALVDICLPFESVIFESNKIFSMNIIPDVEYYGNEGRLKQLGVILLDNAIKNSNDGETIDFSLQIDQTKNKLLLAVTNTGPGIPREHRDKIFERFYRVDPSRARDTGGYGLGLSIAKTIANQHDGTIEVISTESGPTTFLITLPYKFKTTSSNLIKKLHLR